jgi:hypothetical protein
MSVVCTIRRDGLQIFNFCIQLNEIEQACQVSVAGFNQTIIILLEVMAYSGQKSWMRHVY